MKYNSWPDEAREQDESPGGKIDAKIAEKNTG